MSAGQFYADKLSHFVFKWVRSYALAEMIGPLVTFGDDSVGGKPDCQPAS